ncbi:VOC family protein [Lacimicrobium sp. SS2-24]|uniref:VOC family protein n=1 Tax=Lacimicrobium sp. SS2-24 TaxID=2005569 RepID=UPI000B4A7E8E|nr:VOC family protein [Lacimicrobium sp. SS2-24]
MMQLEHLNLVVRDLEQSLRFYQAAFPHWRIRGKGEADWYGTPRNWIHFGDAYQYLTLNDNGSGDNRDLTSNRVGLAHFAFITRNLEAVITRLKDAGFSPAKQGSEDPYRSNIYYLDPDGFEVEFVQYHSDLPEKRNLYL